MRTFIIFLLLLSFVLYISSPILLQKFGIHHRYTPTKEYFLKNKRVLIVTTSTSIDAKGENTGVFLSELIIPYYILTDAGVKVDITSISGGPVPVDPLSYKFFLKIPELKRMADDSTLNAKLSNTKKIDIVNFNAYDAIYIPGGVGAAYDMQSPTLTKKLSYAYQNGKIIAANGLGVLALVNMKDSSKKFILARKRVTGMTTDQIRELKWNVPIEPAKEMKKVRAVYRKNSAILDTFSNFVIVDDKIITGQNQNSSSELAYKLLDKMLEK